MAAKKPAVVEKIKKVKPKIAVKIPKSVSSSPDRIWRRMMIVAIQEQAQIQKHGMPKEEKSSSPKHSAVIAE